MIKEHQINEMTRLACHLSRALIKDLQIKYLQQITIKMTSW